MAGITYRERRSKLQTYFDQTAAEAWSRLTSDAPVSGIRATVRAGRDRMRELLLHWLPADLSGARLLDAGCGTGALASAAADRGAEVLGIDLSPTLVELARERHRGHAGPGSMRFLVGDMLDAGLGEFDYVVAMDSLIHYETDDMVAVLESFTARASRACLFTFAPRTAPLALMHAVGRLFPRGDRAPAIEPVAEPALRERLLGDLAGAGWAIGRSARIASGFYTSQAMELRRP